jgi:hypothetical protein
MYKKKNEKIYSQIYYSVLGNKKCLPFIPTKLMTFWMKLFLYTLLRLTSYVLFDKKSVDYLG